MILFSFIFISFLIFFPIIFYDISNFYGLFNAKAILVEK